MERSTRPVLVVRHSPTEGPGTLAKHLRAAGVRVQPVALDRGEPLPGSPETFAGIVLMGGTMSVNDPLPWIEPECELVRQAVEAGVPVLGICLGAQMIAKALGAAVGPNPVPEIGWYPVERLPEPAGDPWLDGLPSRFEVLHWHGETFELPEGARPILASERCPRQGFVLGGHVLALQCHVEMTAPMVRRWVADNRELLASGRPGISAAEEILDRLDERVADLARVAQPIFRRFAELVRQPR